MCYLICHILLPYLSGTVLYPSFTVSYLSCTSTLPVIYFYFTCQVLYFTCRALYLTCYIYLLNLSFLSPTYRNHTLLAFTNFMNTPVHKYYRRTSYLIMSYLVKILKKRRKKSVVVKRVEDARVDGSFSLA